MRTINSASGEPLPDRSACARRVPNSGSCWTRSWPAYGHGDSDASLLGGRSESPSRHSAYKLGVDAARQTARQAFIGGGGGGGGGGGLDRGWHREVGRVRSPECDKDIMLHSPRLQPLMVVAPDGRTQLLHQ